MPESAQQGGPNPVWAMPEYTRVLYKGAGKWKWKLSNLSAQLIRLKFSLKSAQGNFTSTNVSVEHEGNYHDVTFEKVLAIKMKAQQLIGWSLRSAKKKAGLGNERESSAQPKAFDALLWTLRCNAVALFLRLCNYYSALHLNWNAMDLFVSCRNITPCKFYRNCKMCKFVKSCTPCKFCFADLQNLQLCALAAASAYARLYEIKLAASGYHDDHFSDGLSSPEPSLMMLIVITQCYMLLMTT